MQVPPLTVSGPFIGHEDQLAFHNVYEFVLSGVGVPRRRLPAGATRTKFTP